MDAHLSALDEVIDVVLVAQDPGRRSVPKGAGPAVVSTSILPPPGARDKAKLLTHPVSGSRILVLWSFSIPQSPRVARWRLDQNFWAIFFPSDVKWRNCRNHCMPSL